MRRIQKKTIAAIVAGMAFSFGGIGGSAIITPPQLPFKSIIQPINVVQAATPATRSSLSLITDDTNSVLSKTDTQEMQDEEQKIHQSGEASVNYDFYTYLYNDGAVKAKDKAKEITDAYVQKGSSVPFIFVLNKADNSFHFVEDTKLAPYTSSAYLVSLAKQTFQNGVSADKVKEFTTRVDSTLFMSVTGDFGYTGQMAVNDAASKAYVDIVDFSSKTAPAKQDKQKDDAEKEDKQEEPSPAVPAILAFVLAAATIGWFVKKKRQG